MLDLGSDGAGDLRRRDRVPLGLDAAIDDVGDILGGEGRTARVGQGADDVHRAIANFDGHLGAELDTGGDGVEDVHRFGLS